MHRGTESYATNIQGSSEIAAGGGVEYSNAGKPCPRRSAGANEQDYCGHLNCCLCTSYN